MNEQVERMLASPRLEQGVRAFFTDMLVMEKYDDLAKDPVLYPAFTLKVANEAKEQTLRIIVDHLINQNGDYRDLFTTRRIFLTQTLGSIYRIPVSAPGPLDWIAHELPESDPRAGILTQIGFLSVNAHPGRSSATLRGKALREIFMCQKVPDPPPNVDFSLLEEPNPNLHTARDRLDLHRTNPVCAGCHKITDPIGLALENFDGAGQYRDKEDGAVINASGELSGVDFGDAKGLGAVVRNDPALVSCVTQRLFQYAVGRPVSEAEKPVVAYFQKQFSDKGHSVVELLRTIATSEVFFKTTGHAAATAAK